MTTHKIYPGVTIGKGAVIGDFVIIGIPPRDKEPGELVTSIGAGAIIRSHTVIYAGNIIGDDFQTGHGAVIREGNRISNNVSIGSGTVVEGYCTIEDGVKVHSQVMVAEYVVLKAGCWIAPHVILTNTLHPRCSKADECRKRAPVVEEKAKIGVGAMVLPGLVIGADSLVGAAAVVTKDVPPGVVVAGSPAKVIKSIRDIVCPYGLVTNPYED